MGISKRADDLAEQGPVQHRGSSCSPSLPWRRWESAISPSLLGAGRKSTLPALSSTVFPFFISLSLVGRAGRSHCNRDIYSLSLEYWPLHGCSSPPASPHGTGAGTPHLPVCIWPALAACLQGTDCKAVCPRLCWRRSASREEMV